MGQPRGVYSRKRRAMGGLHGCRLRCMGAADARHATGGGDGLHLSMLRCRGAADAEQTTGDIRTPGQAARPRSAILAISRIAVEVFYTSNLIRFALHCALVCGTVCTSLIGQGPSLRSRVIAHRRLHAPGTRSSSTVSAFTFFFEIEDFGFGLIFAHKTHARSLGGK